MTGPLEEHTEAEKRAKAFYLDTKQNHGNTLVAINLRTAQPEPKVTSSYKKACNLAALLQSHPYIKILQVFVLKMSSI